LDLDSYVNQAHCILLVTKFTVFGTWKEVKQLDKGTLKIPFFRIGTWKHPSYGNIEGSKEMFNKMIDNFKSNVLGKPPFIRIGHDKSNAPTFGSAEALGWVKDIVEEDGVLYGLADPTSPEVQDMIRNKKYLFASAEYTPNYTDKESGLLKGPVLTAISLTNEPFLTRLPRAVVLSDQEDTFYMDFVLADQEGNDEDLETKGILQKLSDMVTGFMKKTEEVQTATNVKLSEMEKQMSEQVKLAQQQSDIFKQQAAEAESARRLAEVDKQAAEMVGVGIPPAMVEQWKQFALSEQANVSIKLSEGSEISAADNMKNMLLALPQEQRIKLGQNGAQTPVNEDEKVALAAREDVIAIGGKVDENGKFII